MTVYRGPDAARLAGDALRQFVKDQPKAERNALRKVSAGVRREVVKSFTATGIGRALFGAAAVKSKARARTKALRAVFPMPRVQPSGTGWVLSLTLKGIPALTEVGGHTKGHRIEGRDGVLAFRAGGSEKFAKRVNHPGSRMPHQPYLQRAAEASLAGIVQAMDASLAELGTKVIG